MRRASRAHGAAAWIAQASLLAMFGCLIAGGLLVNTLAVMWPGLLLVRFFAYTLCVAETRKYNMVVEHLHTRAHLRALAEQDSLTALPTAIISIPTCSCCAWARPKNFALVLIDLDRFKAVNDTRGHAAGDALIRARRRPGCARSAGRVILSPGSAATSSPSCCRMTVPARSLPRASRWRCPPRS